MTGLSLESVLLVANLLVLVALLAIGLANRPALGVPLVLAVTMALSASISLEVTVGELQIYAGDVLSITLLVATMLRLQQRGEVLRPPGVLVAVLLVLALSIVRGIGFFGVEPPFAAAREILSMLAAALFFSTVRVTPALIRTARNWLLLASAVLVIAAAVFWIEHGFGTFAATGDRAINGLQALIVLVTTIITVLFPPSRDPLLRLFVPLTGAIVVVLSTQRTVWAAGLVAAAVLVVARPKSRRSTSAAPRLLVMAAAVAVVLLVAAGPSGVTSDLQAGYQQTSGEDSTFSWRLEGWAALLDRQLTGSAVDLVAGAPAGTGEARVIDGSVVRVAAHSMYVSTLDIAGLVGLALLLWLGVSTLAATRRLLRAASGSVAQAALLFTALLASLLTYFVGYSTGFFAGLILGLACGFAHGHRRDVPLDRRDVSVDRPAHRWFVAEV